MDNIESSGIIDLHTHTFFSDGVLIPSELVYTAKQAGYEAIAITDHVDFSNMDSVIPKILKAAHHLEQEYGIVVLVGAEITYVPPKLIDKAAKECRNWGAEIIVVHGETLAENVPPETNFYAASADIDILAHPGFLTKEVAEIARDNDVKIELAARIHHGRKNKEIAEIARAVGAKMVIDSDAHKPQDLLSHDLIQATLALAGLEPDYYKTIRANAYEIVKSCLSARQKRT
jgi:histidinol phosphatase-like PHP family hydrolase